MKPNKPTFQEQYNKVVEAYYKNNLNPFHCEQCFVGNILPAQCNWHMLREFKEESTLKIVSKFPFIKKVTKINYLNRPYKTIEINEYILAYANKALQEIESMNYTLDEIIELEHNFLSIYINGGETEDTLFNAMESTLLMLRKIHESKGEIIKDYQFNKRINVDKILSDIIEN